MTPEETSRPGAPFLVGRKKELIQAKRTIITVGEREILVIHHQGVFYAMDQHCYHAGGSLLNGDIEEIASKLCIVCPKHKYKIRLADGEGLYKIPNHKAKDQPPHWCSKGVKQRVHRVDEENGNIFVTLSTFPGWLESDYYQTEEGRKELKRAQQDSDKTSK